MSTGARVTVGLVALACGVSFLFIAITAGDVFPTGPMPFYGFAVFCFVVFVACLFRKSRPLTLRIIGGVLCLSYLFYLYDSIQKGNWPWALAGFLVVGLPAGYLMITGTYPEWGRASAAFTPKYPRGSDDEL